MEISEETIGELMAVGAASLVFNAPLSDARASALAKSLPDGVVTDLGCGRGGFVRRIALERPVARVRGIDSDGTQIDSARSLAAEAGLENQVEFIVGDAAEWTSMSDAVVCIGASHAFGDTAGMLGRLAGLVPGDEGPPGIAVIGDGIWQNQPDDWCLETFGELPTIEDLVALAAAAGWSVDDVSTSTLEEWDAFEHGWIDGVRSVGTPEAAAFADERQAEYGQYRNVLGFAWAVLSRPERDA